MGEKYVEGKKYKFEYIEKEIWVDIKCCEKYIWDSLIILNMVLSLGKKVLTYTVLGITYNTLEKYYNSGVYLSWKYYSPWWTGKGYWDHEKLCCKELKEFCLIFGVYIYFNFILFNYIIFILFCFS